jgi:hypothetical protein
MKLPRRQFLHLAVGAAALPTALRNASPPPPALVGGCAVRHYQTSPRPSPGSGSNGRGIARLNEP